MRVGAGSSVAEVDASSRRPRCSSTLPALGGERLELGSQAAVELDHVHRARAFGASRSVSAPPPPPTSSTTSSAPTSASRTIASSRFGSARKFWPRRRCWRSPRSRGASSLTSRTPARRSRRPSARAPRRRRRAPRRPPRAVATTFAGWFGLPRTGCGARNGRVGLDQQQLVGDDRRRLAQLLGLGVGDVAGERAVPAALGGPLGPAPGRPRSSGGSRRLRRPRSARVPNASSTGLARSRRGRGCGSPAACRRGGRSRSGPRRRARCSSDSARSR